MTLPNLWCPLPPCRVRHFSEPPSNGARGYESKDAYLDHIEERHHILRVAAPAPLYRGETDPRYQYRYIAPRKVECLGCSHEAHEPGKCTSLTSIFRRRCLCTETRSVNVWAVS